MSRAASFRYARVVFLLVLDLLFLVGTYTVLSQSAWFAHGIVDQILEYGSQDNIPLMELVGFQLLCVVALGGYRSKEFSTDCSSLIRALLFSGLAIAFISNILTIFPRSLDLSILLFFTTFGVLLTSRFFVRGLIQIFRRYGYFQLSAFVVSDSAHGETLLETIKNKDYYHIVGSSDSSFLDVKTRSESVQRLMDLGVDELVVDWKSISNRRYVLRSIKLSGMKVRVFFLDRINSLNEFYPKKIRDFGLLALNPNLFVDLDFRIKRMADFICAAAFLLLFSPVYLVIAIAIRLDSPGGVFYQQTRVGLHGKPIQVWKFRSMVNNADQLQKKLENLNESSDGILFKMKEDPRITKIGKFIRRYSLDELPQIFNVLVGDMSFIGPRPLPLRDVQRFSKPYFFVRHDVLPGITGLWQVSGRSDIDNFEDAVSLDLEYIENWSLSLDLEIVFRTFGVILKKSGAY